ncbi:MAG: hypothetical protein AAF467_09985 [Actinomycetota bacterium]
MSARRSELEPVEPASEAGAVLQRAIRLAEVDVDDAVELPVASLEQIAAELGIPLAALAEAMAEFRAGALDDATGVGETAAGVGPKVLTVLVGPGQVAVRQRTGLTETETTERLQDWLKRRHRLRTRRDHRGAVVGVRRRGMLSSAARSVSTATGRAGLSGIKEVRGAAVGVDGGATAFVVVADVREQRARSLAMGSAVAATGTAVAVTAAVVTAPVSAVGVPVAVGVGWLASRVAHGRSVRRVTEEVEITADEVAAGVRPPTISDQLSAGWDRVYKRAVEKAEGSGGVPPAVGATGSAASESTLGPAPVFGPNDPPPVRPPDPAPTPTPAPAADPRAEGSGRRSRFGRRRR